MNHLVFQVDSLRVARAESVELMSALAAKEAAVVLRQLLAKQEEVFVMFAAAESQICFLSHLAKETGIDWGRVIAYNMDEYIGLTNDHPDSLSAYLVRTFLNKVSVKEARLLNGAANDPVSECNRYARLLESNRPDLVFMGIGDNGHLAFNDPHVADFMDPKRVKIVDIDNTSKSQQVNSGNFANADVVPSLAYTVTIPALLDCQRIFCVVPFKSKALAVSKALGDAISEVCPASILRNCSHATLYLDADSSARLDQAFLAKHATD